MIGHKQPYNENVSAPQLWRCPSRRVPVERLLTGKRCAYTPVIKPLENLKEDISLGQEVQMNSRTRLATFSLLLLLSVCFVCWPVQAMDERTAAGPLDESRTAHNSAGLPQAGQGAGPQSAANETGPLFRVVKDGKVGYIDKTGKFVWATTK